MQHTTRNRANGTAVTLIIAAMCISMQAFGQSLLQFNTDNLTIPSSRLRSGGPPKDGIPSLTRPRMIPATAAGYLQTDDRIVVVRVDNDVRGYPIAILNWHEIVNDTVGNTPVAIIYCPLCDSVSVVDRRIEGETLEFGVSGYLYESNVLLFDRTHDALWSQVGLKAISGPYAGHSLRHLPWEITTFNRFSEAHPTATVLSDHTGYARNYRSNPYADYFRRGSLMFPVSNTDRRLSRMEPVVGVRLADVVIAYPVKTIAAAKNGQLQDRIANERLLLEADRDGGVRIVELPAQAEVVHTFWFAWAALHPKTEIHKNP